MKILLDECVTHAFRSKLSGHDVYTVAYMNWSGIRNGELLRRAASEEFDLLMTTDTAMPDQHNPATLPISVLVVHTQSSRLADLEVHVPAILEILNSITRIGFYVVK